jgi:16S rRNA (uracil1498-N3)-methyltransferase
MQLFYQQGLQEGIWTMSEEESKHVIQVLRHKKGDELSLIDGQGGWFSGCITDLGKRSCVLEVTCIRREAFRANYRVTLAVAPTKRMERLEWLVEKATELGFDELIPLRTSRGERSQLRTDRLVREAIAATKQSLQAWVPVIREPMRLEECLLSVKAAQRFIGWCPDEPPPPLVVNCQPAKDVLILIGPEGDFTEQEVGLAVELGCQPFTLGKVRLRTETAALTACMCVRFINDLADTKS